MRDTQQLPQLRRGATTEGWFALPNALWRSEALVVLATLAALSLGIIVRAAHVLAAPFPLNDGGMFYAMTRDLQQAAYRLPTFTSYNEANIPFGYSPLSFYLAAALQQALGVPLLDLLRWLPLLATSLTVVAFWLLARTLLQGRWTVIVAVTAFALLPRGFIWMLMGGGLTRSLGFLFAIVTLYQLQCLYQGRRSWWYAVGAMVGGALTAGSHLGTAPFLAASALLFWFGAGRPLQGLLRALAAAAGAALLTAPWWYTVIATHGLAPFLAAQHAGSTILSLRTWERLPGVLAWGGFGTAESLLPLIGMLALLGVLVACVQRCWLLPAWWILILLVDTRAGTTYAALPVAMLAGIGIVEGLVPLISTLHRVTLRQRGQPSSVLAQPVGVISATLTLLFAASLASALFSRPQWPGELRFLAPLSPEDQAAMRWVESTTALDHRFLLITGSGWEVDRVSEWFPVLAERVSVATVQGSEWLPGNAFDTQRQRYNDVQGCATWETACVEQWERSTGVRFTHLYIPKSADAPCCEQLRLSVRSNPNYYIVYDGPGATIAQRRPLIAQH